MGDRRFRRRFQQSLQGSAQEAAAHAAARPHTRAPHSRGGRHTARTAPVPHPDGCAIQCPTTAARPACAAAGASASLCEVNAKGGTQNTVMPAALATGNCELRTRAMVREILLDDRGSATGVAYFDEHDRLQTQLADLVVVSASAVESPRLLLNSKHRLFPAGLGNRYDWVGRNLQGHTYSGAVGEFRGGGLRRSRPRRRHRDQRFQSRQSGTARRRGCWATNSSACRSSSSAFCRPARRAGAQAHKDAMRAYLQTHHRRAGADAGDADLRLRASSSTPSVRDRWGIPVARISGDRHPHTIEIATRNGR